jgi:beta-lactam-binding protein with PASTA domain
MFSVCAPDFVGLSVDQALTLADSVGVRVSAADEDAAPLTERFGVVTAQNPPAGVALPAGADIVVTTVDGPGDAGAREPRRPLPVCGPTWAGAESA